MRCGWLVRSLSVVGGHVYRVHSLFGKHVKAFYEHFQSKGYYQLPSKGTSYHDSKGKLKWHLENLVHHVRLLYLTISSTACCASGSHAGPPGGTAEKMSRPPAVWRLGTSFGDLAAPA